MATTSSIVIFVNDIEKNIEYFTHTLGFREVERWQGADGQTAHATVAFGTGAKAGHVDIASTRSVTEGMGDYDFGQFGENIRNSPQTLGNGIILFFRVPNVDKFYQKIQANGAIIDEPPTDQMWGQRTISVLTPDNYYMTFYQPIKGWKPPPEMAPVKPTKGRATTTTTTKRTASKKKR